MRSPSSPQSASPLLPQFRLLAGVVVGRDALARGVVLVDPGPEVGRAQLGEGQHQVAQVALGIDDDGRDAVEGRLFEQADAEARLAAAGHAHADGVGHEVLGVVEQQIVLERARGQVVGPTQVERPQLLEVLHRPSLAVVGTLVTHPYPGARPSAPYLGQTRADCMRRLSFCNTSCAECGPEDRGSSTTPVESAPGGTLASRNGTCAPRCTRLPFPLESPESACRRSKRDRLGEQVRDRGTVVRRRAAHPGRVLGRTQTDRRQHPAHQAHHAQHPAALGRHGYRLGDGAGHRARPRRRSDHHPQEPVRRAAGRHGAQGQAE